MGADPIARPSAPRRSDLVAVPSRAAWRASWPGCDRAAHAEGGLGPPVASLRSRRRRRGSPWSAPASSHPSAPASDGCRPTSRSRVGSGSPTLPAARRDRIPPCPPPSHLGPLRDSPGFGQRPSHALVHGASISDGQPSGVDPRPSLPLPTEPLEQRLDGFDPEDVRPGRSQTTRHVRGGEGRNGTTGPSGHRARATPPASRTAESVASSTDYAVLWSPVADTLRDPVDLDVTTVGNWRRMAYHRECGTVSTSTAPSDDRIGGIVHRRSVAERGSVDGFALRRRSAPCRAAPPHTLVVLGQQDPTRDERRRLRGVGKVLNEGVTSLARRPRNRVSSRRRASGKP